MMLPVFAGVWSCDSYLDVDGYFDDTLKYDSIFSNRQNLERYLWGAAGELPDESAIFGNDVCPGITGSDEIFTLMDYGLFHGKAITLDLVSPSDLRGMNSWSPSYKVIRKANMILARIDECKDITPLQRAELIGYAHFLRGYAYYFILMNHGPAVLLGDEVFDNNLNTEDYDRPRATFDETVDYICSELEIAAQNIPDDVPIANFGRPTRGAAYALIARVRLHAASDAFNGGASARRYFGNWTRSTDGVNYVSQNYDERKWALAAAACQRVIDMNRYQLHTIEWSSGADDNTQRTPDLPENVSHEDFPYGAGNIDPFKSYSQLFNGNTYAVQNKEIIWAKSTGNVTDFTRQSFPIYMGGYNGMCIPQRMIDEFRMQDGKTIEEAARAGEYDEVSSQRGVKYFSGYRIVSGTNNMYVNREMRFYANVGFNGCYWPGSSCSNNSFSNQTVYYYTGGNAGPQQAVSSHEPRNTCITGYVLKKYIHPDDNWYSGDGAMRVSKTFYIIRYGEILLSYAEAINHLTQEHKVDMASGQSYTLSRASKLNDAIFAMNQIRFRSGQPGLTVAEYADEESMEQTIRHERLIEMFCEGRRYYDIRRWGIMEEVESQPIIGMNVNGSSNNYYERTMVDHADSRNKTVDRKMVFLPLTRNEVLKAKMLDQNPGW